ncbi:MAG: hypothetical protein H0Z28_08030 [Archaeoglobus sp.]|nr:hypothetical protein [Archaeoglobus sp.]
MAKKPKHEILSNELKVAAEIYYQVHEKGEKVWFNKLVELLSDYMSRSTIQKALNVLFDWGIVKGEYGETEKGRAGRLLLIATEHKDTIRKIYETYWKDKDSK